jgi:hypothetical protein
MNMDKIKSAWEIALEKTKNVKADPRALKEQQYLEQGKKYISAYLENPQSEDLKARLKAIEKEYETLVKRGMLDTLLSNLNLPLTDYTEQRNAGVRRALTLIFPDSKKVEMVFGQLEQFFGRYKEDRENIQEQVKARYMPKLRAKAEAIARQLGTQVELDPFTDPEFNALLNKNLAQFDEKYNTVLGQAKEELRHLLK